MDATSNNWNWGTSLASTVLPHALTQASSIVWTDKATPITSVLTPDGDLHDDEVTWRSTRNFRGQQGPVSHVIVRVQFASTSFEPVLMSCKLVSKATDKVRLFSTVEQIMWSAPSPLRNLCLSRNEEGAFVENTDAPKPFHLGENQKLYV
jgi:hypothetical protein